MYKINDVCVYKRDVCKVVGKQKSPLNGEMCYILVPYYQADGTIKMQVPVSNKSGNIRDILTKKEIDKLIKETPDIASLPSKPANMKSQYTSLLKGTEITDLICIMKTSYGRNKVRQDQNKKAASVDDEYLKKAEKYLFEEMSVALGKSVEDAKKYFEKAVAKASTTKKPAKKTAKKK